MLTKSNILMHYNPSLPVTLAGDVSNYGIGAVISHVTPEGHQKPVMFA